MATKANLEQDLSPETNVTPTTPQQPASELEALLSRSKTLSAREINLQLALIQEHYEEMSQQFAQNQQQVNATIDQIKAISTRQAKKLDEVNKQFSAEQQQVEALFSEQSSATKALKDSTNAHIESLASKIATQSKAQADNYADVKQQLSVLNDLQSQQTQLAEAHSLKLVELQTAATAIAESTRGNKKRISELKDDVERQQLLTDTEIQGLKAITEKNATNISDVLQLTEQNASTIFALQEKLGAETARIEIKLEQIEQALVERIEAESAALQTDINSVETELQQHETQTAKRFQLTSVGFGIAAMLVLAVAAMFKWSPALVPVKHDQQLAALKDSMAGIEGAMSQTHATTTAELTDLSSDINALNQQDLAIQAQQASVNQHVNDVQQAVDDLNFVINGPGMVTASSLTPKLPLNTLEWLTSIDQQSYIIQLVSVYSYDDLAIFSNRHETALSSMPLAYTSTEILNRTRFNLFAGQYTEFDDAIAAIQALPLSIRVNQPWVRKVEDVVRVAQ